VQKYSAIGKLQLGIEKSGFSQGGLVTHLKCPAVFDGDFTANWPLSLSLENCKNWFAFGKITDKSMMARSLTRRGRWPFCAVLYTRLSLALVCDVSVW